MGAWGVGIFENDAACDWAADLVGGEDLSAVAETLRLILETSDDYLDADLASQGLAACEVIARLKGNWGTRDAYTEKLDEWVTARRAVPATYLVEQARAAITRVLKSPSELLELWEESDDSQAWHESVSDLFARVSK
jgi:hypothetical protein